MQAEAESLWSLLPPQFRLESNLESYNRQPIELDFMVSARLNHLHVQFLLRLALVSSIHEPDPQLVAISSNMLSIVVQGMIFKDHLANSGTSHIWRVSETLSPHYSLNISYFIHHFSFGIDKIDISLGIVLWAIGCWCALPRLTTSIAHEFWRSNTDVNGY